MARGFGSAVRVSSLAAVSVLISYTTASADGVTVNGEYFICTTNIAGIECEATSRTVAQDAIRRAGGLEKEEFCRPVVFGTFRYGEDCEVAYNEALIRTGLLKKGGTFWAGSSFEIREDENTLVKCKDEEQHPELMSAERFGYCHRVKFRVFEQAVKAKATEFEGAAGICPAQSKQAIQLVKELASAQLRYFKAKVHAHKHDDPGAKQRLADATARLDAAEAKEVAAVDVLNKCVGSRGNTKRDRAHLGD